MVSSLSSQQRALCVQGRRLWSEIIQFRS
jgi:hypothetical protein